MALLYPQPYLGEVLRSLPIAVVDQDHTELSRDFVQALNADQALAVTAEASTLAEAQAALDRHDVYAIVAIPKDTERQVLRGEQARIAAYVDAAYLLLYSQTLQGISEAAATASADVALRGARTDGSLAYAALVQSRSGRVRVRAAVQSDRRLRRICCAGRIRADPAADAAAWRRVDRRRGVRARRTPRAASCGRARAPSSARRSPIFASRSRALRSI